MNLGVLAAAEQVKPPTMSRLVKDMEANGLVQRERDPHDARGVILAPTEKGRAMFDRARELRLDALRRAIAVLPDEDQADLSRAAALVHALVRALDGTPPRP